MEARLNAGIDPVSFGHPIFDSVRPWLEQLGDFSLANLNRLAEASGIATENGRPVRFVPPSHADPYYEIQLFETGRVQTRPGNRHDLFNALAWLAFPRTKARINARHAAEIPRERETSGGRRGRLRDMLTIFDEGGAIVAGTPEAAALVRAAGWRELFVERHRDFRIVVVGHAVLEQALAPYAGITCKVIFADPARDLDEQAARWLAGEGRTPRDLPPLPVFGYPGWLPQSGDPAFYGDTRYFRPLPQGKIGTGVGQAAAVPGGYPSGAEESPGSEERDAG